MSKKTAVDNDDFDEEKAESHLQEQYNKNRGLQTVSNTYQYGDPYPVGTITTGTSVGSMFTFPAKKKSQATNAQERHQELLDKLDELIEATKANRVYPQPYVQPTFPYNPPITPWNPGPTWISSPNISY